MVEEWTVHLTSGGFMFKTFVILPCNDKGITCQKSTYLKLWKNATRGVKLTCMMRKCGLFTLRPTEQNKSWTLVFLALTPLMRYLFLPPITTLEKESISVFQFILLHTFPFLYPNFWILTCLVTVISSCVSNPSGLWLLLELSNVMDTVALVIPPCPFLYTKSWRLEART